MKKILKIIYIIIIGIVFVFCILFFYLFAPIFFGGNVKIFNTTNENFTGQIKFFQHKNLLHSENFEISKNENKNFSVPNQFNEGDIKIFIKNNSDNAELTISNDYLYSFNVNEKIFIKKENEIFKLEKH